MICKINDLDGQSPIIHTISPKLQLPIIVFSMNILMRYKRVPLGIDIINKEYLNKFNAIGTNLKNLFYKKIRFKNFNLYLNHILILFTENC